ncbi:ROK family transcriptional regulator [Clostridium felsineum]|uniref:N-acetylglucosamine repressor n=1 Tax=Clostridium felsineum TaxID=36839 RepID=A0A1S8MA85_9CLOT|nr:ROK family transcriptional regulator [Clostridium felsineum]MCR3760492.1 ROK family transcriptional regulator [Clostridium felsineum]URZ02875.1 N-acetylglucosamine repressor [Clostridium felsineum]URZ08788.1 N-acetylglucosamine repressor [Clostridium felsineum]URZ09416.1 N-acetylglucosamine repressor [Clostridium felsineum]
MFDIDQNSNKGKILNLLYRKRELTKLDISNEIGVSVPTVISNVNELIREGFVEESGVAISTGGRKPIIVSFLPNSRYAFGVDINPDKARVILTNLDLDIKYDAEFLINEVRDIDSAMKKISEIIKEALEFTKVDEKKVLGIGFSLQGTVDEKELVLKSAINIGIKDWNFRKFENLFEFPMFIENEANAAALAELKIGIAKEERNLVYISVSSGLGTGIVIEGQLYKGKNKRAGEIGHMTIVPHGKLCRCGRKGCWEMYASQKALLNEFNELSDTKIEKLEDFFKLLDARNEVAEKCMENYLDALATGIQNIVLIFDPHYIVLGGEISGYSDVYLDRLKDKIFIKNEFYSREDFKLLPSRLKSNSSILGASLLPIQKAFLIEEQVI